MLEDLVNYRLACLKLRLAALKELYYSRDLSLILKTLQIFVFIKIKKKIFSKMFSEILLKCKTKVFSRHLWIYNLSLLKSLFRCFRKGEKEHWYLLVFVRRFQLFLRNFSPTVGLLLLPDCWYAMKVLKHYVIH